MSESATTHSKTLSESGDSDSTDTPLVKDRWSNNITYRQLVLSSCIGIYQLCWNPYLFDLKRLLPFLFLYNVFSVVIAYPMFYLELAMGIVTKKGVLNCWDISPAARGVGFAMLGCCMFTALSASAMGSRCLALLVHSLHSFLPWLHCAAGANPPCAARHRPISPDAETPAQSFYFNYVLKLKRDGLEGGLGNIVWELAIYYAICWFLIYCVAIKRVYSYSKLVLFKDVLAFFVLVCSCVGALRLDGLKAIFTEYDWSTLFEGFQMSVGQGSLTMLGSYLPKQSHKLGTTALLALAVSKTTCMGTTLVLAANFSALKTDYDDKATVPGGTASSMIMWADFVARIPGSQFWSALVFFTFFVMSISTAVIFGFGLGTCWTLEKSIAGCLLVAIIVTPIFLFFAISFIFKCRVRNIVGEK